MVGAAELAAMKPTAYVVNTARGGIVDEAALVDALERRVIAGAAVDAFEVEPATEDNPTVRAGQYPGESPLGRRHGRVHVPDGGGVRPERRRLL